jgi:hypothetical protein
MHLSTVRVDGENVSETECDLSVRGGYGRSGWQRRHRGDHDGKQHKKTDSSGNQKPHIASSPWD